MFEVLHVVIVYVEAIRGIRGYYVYSLTCQHLDWTDATSHVLHRYLVWLIPCNWLAAWC